MSVVIETTIGDLTVDLFTEERPIACLNFIKLCKLKYYNYNLFHTIEHGFIAQTGDPSGVGDGGSSIWGVVEGQHKRFFEAESLPKIHHTTAGLLSLVSAGKHLVGSQFFFTLGENLSSLDAQHCVIGEVVEGNDVLRHLNEAIVDENFRPYQDIRITHTVILEDPFPDPRGFREPSRSPSPSVERLINGRIAADENIDDTEGKSMEEIQEMLAERESKARATILEIVGDLPDAEMAPPENVLFVCKLNPVTTDDDLEIIFSRFGKVKGCEVIRDRKTGDSLQYAFVEFEEQKSCEAAYFKMDNVLIDDRRIHVDFSQSVSKVKWRGKGRGIEGDSKGIDFNHLRDKGDEKNKNDRKEYQNDRKVISTAKVSGNNDVRLRRSSESRHRSPNGRRKNVEQHMKKEMQRRKYRSRSRDRSCNEIKEKSRYYDKSKERRRSKSPTYHGRRERNSGHGSRYSPCRERYDRYKEKELNNDKYGSEGSGRYTKERNDDRRKSLGNSKTRTPVVERERNYKSPEYRKENYTKHLKKQKQKEKKSKGETSSSRKSSSSDNSSDSSDSETSSSESDSSTAEKRRKISKKKKNKSSKKKKTSKKMKSKK